jgi:hypothetical protein
MNSKNDSIKNTVSLVHCIENKFDNKFERESKLYIESFKNLNAELYQNVSIHFMQPNNNDIEENTIEYFENNKINFYKIPLIKETQGINYFNKVLVCEWFSENLNSEFMCFLDNDIIFLKKIKKELFKNVEKPVICIEFFNEQIEKIYFEHYRPYLKKEYQLKNLNCHINTWFIYAKTKDKIWKKWSELTKELRNINNKEQEMICEELAMTILYCKNPNEFLSLSDFFQENQLSIVNTGNDRLDLKNNTEIFHYSDIFDKDDINYVSVQGKNYKSEIIKILQKASEKKFIDKKTFINLIKNMKE